MGLIQHIKEFGLPCSFAAGFSRPLSKLSPRISAAFISRIKRPALCRYLRKNYGNLVFDEQPVAQSPDEKKIWVFWAQGEENAPDVVKACIRSIRHHGCGHDVVVLTLDNLTDYVDIPEHIMAKFHQGKMTTVAFSDIVRYHVVAQHGGVYFDATCFLISDIPDAAFSLPFYSMKGVFGYPLDLDWTSFHMGGDAHNPIAENMCRLYDAYWKDHDMIIAYILVDYLVDTVCRCSETARRLVDQTPDGLRPFVLQEKINEPYLGGDFSEIGVKNYVQKMSFQSLIRDAVSVLPDGRKTNYGMILGKYI